MQLWGMSLSWIRQDSDDAPSSSSWWEKERLKTAADRQSWFLRVFCFLSFQKFESSSTHLDDLSDEQTNVTNIRILLSKEFFVKVKVMSRTNDQKTFIPEMYKKEGYTI